MGYQPKYCPECGSETYGNKVCALCDFEMDLVNVNDTGDIDALIFIIILLAVPIILTILFIFNICFICKFAEWI